MLSRKLFLNHKPWKESSKNIKSMFHICFDSSLQIKWYVESMILIRWFHMRLGRVSFPGSFIHLKSKLGWFKVFLWIIALKFQDGFDGTINGYNHGCWRFIFGFKSVRKKSYTSWLPDLIKYGIFQLDLDLWQCTAKR